MVSRLFPTAISKAAAARLLPFATRIETLRHLPNGAIQVTYRVAGGRRCSTFLSRKAFERDFVEFRIQGAKQVQVRRWGAGSYTNHYDCYTPGSDRHYTVRALGYAVMCECPDYERQSQEVTDVRCKHVLAVLNSLGHSNLGEYIEAKAAAAKADLFGSMLSEAELDEAVARF